MTAGNPLPQRKIFSRLSIAAGNALQIADLAAACAALALARSAPSKPAALTEMVAAWLLFYFFCHGIAHWAVGSLLGIRFAFYTVGGTGNPEGYPAGLRWLFEHLPFFGVQTVKASMQKASPNVEGNHVVGGSDVVRGGSDAERGLRPQRARPRQQTVSDLCGLLGHRNAGQQLEKPHRRLFQSAPRPRPFLTQGSCQVVTVFYSMSLFSIHDIMV